VPTSLVIVGQVGGGLGDVTQRTTMPSPTHAPQGTTWPGTPGTTNDGDTVFTPPHQPDRVRSFATEVNVSDGSAGKGLIWSALRPGTYLIESGTEPSIQGPMGLYGVLVVTDASYPGQPVDADVALLLSEIDPLQNMAAMKRVVAALTALTVVTEAHHTHRHEAPARHRHSSHRIDGHHAGHAVHVGLKQCGLIDIVPRLLMHHVHVLHVMLCADPRRVERRENETRCNQERGTGHSQVIQIRSAEYNEA
jgi:hypothetical protein